MAIEFDKVFQQVNDKSPFPWQTALFERFVSGVFPTSCNLPTGLGKTAVIPIWLLALAAAPKVVPRRLVYVVNRRTVVDQATDEAAKIRTRLSDLPELCDALKELCAVDCKLPLAISTLRGQFADNAEWRADPTRPAIIVGTVDMIGSRLLFSGYGCGFKSRPLQAGFLGQDSLIVHDEAHLEPAFQCLLKSIENEQQHGRIRDFKPLKVMELTATSRDEGQAFRLTNADHKNPVVIERFNAKKSIRLNSIEDEKKQLADHVAGLALAHQNSEQAILIFLRRLEDVQGVVDRLRKAKVPEGSIETLTGTMRGFERDKLAKENGVFARFSPDSKAERQPGTVYLVCTSAGEVGVNISADHLVCDLSPFDSMAQRFGRVNRFGQGDARIDVVYSSEFGKDNPLDDRRKRTLSLLEALDGDVSPAALDRLDSAEKQAAYTPPPEILVATDILFDAWAMTSIRGQLPGRPSVADHLHGVPTDWQPAETYIAWRDEVDLFAKSQFSPSYVAELIDDYPLKPVELLRDRSERVAKQLGELAKRHPECDVWLVDNQGSLIVAKLEELAEDKERLDDATVILPPSIGGLTKQGMLDGRCATPVSDVGDEIIISGQRIRERRSVVLDAENPADVQPPQGMRLVNRVLLRTEEATEAGDDSVDATGPDMRLFFVRPRFADDDGSKSGCEVLLADHLRDVARVAERIASELCDEKMRSALVLAAKGHDLGKDRFVWQRSVGNADPSRPWAKSGKVKLPAIRTDYRHEFGSLSDITKLAEFDRQAELRDFTLHVVATHHGRGRPNFTADEVFDPNAAEEMSRQLATEVAIRYAALQRQYGRWGLAFLESLLRAADIEASAKPVEVNHDDA